MSAHEWKAGDRALLPVRLEAPRDDGSVRAIVEDVRGAWVPITVPAADLIPDDRKPEWLPGQPGDVAEWGGQRWMRRRERWCSVGVNANMSALADDDEVPADAVLVLPAKTREA